MDPISGIVGRGNVGGRVDGCDPASYESPKPARSGMAQTQDPGHLSCHGQRSPRVAQALHPLFAGSRSRRALGLCLALNSQAMEPAATS